MFVPYYRGLFSWAWSQTWHLTASRIAFGAAGAVAGFLITWALGGNPAGIGLVGAVLAVPAIAAIVLLGNCVRYPPRLYSEYRKTQETLAVLTQRMTIRRGMANLAHETRVRIVNFRRQHDPLDAAVVHNSALQLVEQADHQLRHATATQRFDTEAASISAVVATFVPSDPESALAELEELQKLIEQQIREGRFD